MTPQEFVRLQEVHRSTTVEQKIVDNSYSLNYNQSCVTCHSTIELNERTDELEYYGIRSVHDGYGLSNWQWNHGVSTQPSVFLVTPNPYWTFPNNPANSWWAPPLTGTSGNRPRTDSPTRDENNNRERSPSTTPSVTAQPQTPVGGSASSPTVSTTVVTTPAPSQPAESTDSARSRGDSSNSSPGRTRSDGTSRDESGNRPR